MNTVLEHLQRLNKGDEISIVLAGMIVDGTFEELVDNCLVLSDAQSRPAKKKQYTLKIPLESIYAWGNEQKKEAKKDKKKKTSSPKGKKES